MYTINWEEQWKIHAPGYENGAVKISLKNYGGPQKEVVMKAGAGFGDLSHPTTRLSLRMLLKLAEKRHVIDVGCGSGVLSLCASAAGALSVTGIDICSDALEHTRQNSVLNGFSVHVKKPGELKVVPRGALLVMNMIRTEQQNAWSSLPKDKGSFTLITSGVLVEEQTMALKLYESWGLKVTEVDQEEGWMSFRMSFV